MKKKYKIFTFFILYTLFVVTLLSTLPSTPALVIPASGNRFKAASSDPIIITHNDNFSLYAASGSGAPGDPWIIRDYVISNNMVIAGIYIRDTTDHFVITNCTVMIGQPGSSSIMLTDVKNGNITANIIGLSAYGIFGTGDKGVNDTLVRDNTFVGNNDYAIRFSKANNVTIAGHVILTSHSLCGIKCTGVNSKIIYNTIVGTASGIYVVGEKCEIMYNTLAYNFLYGIELDANDSDICHNIVHWNGYSLTLKSSSENRIINNSVKNNEQGIKLHSSSNNNTLSNNIASYNNNSINIGQGIWLEDSNNNTIINNVMENNSMYGLRLTRSNDNDIFHNLIKKNNQTAGIFLYNSSDNHIYNNTLNNPTLYGIDLRYYSDSNNITGNTIEGWSNECVRIDFTCDNNIVENNNCEISDDVPPWASAPADATHAQGTIAVITWTLSDNFAGGTYRVLRNGSPYSSWIAWTKNVQFNVTIDTGALGVWNYTIQYNDSVGLWGTPDTVLITITSQEDEDGIPGFALLFGLVGLVAVAVKYYRKKHSGLTV